MPDVWGLNVPQMADCLFAENQSLRAERDAATKRASELETILAALLDAAERQAAGFPIEAERWFAVRDAARAMLPEKDVAQAEPSTRLECSHCGGEAARADADGLYHDAEGACLTCGIHGQIVVEDGVASWDVDEDALCEAADCDECETERRERAAKKEVPHD